MAAQPAKPAVFKGERWQETQKCANGGAGENHHAARQHADSSLERGESGFLVAAHRVLLATPLSPRQRSVAGCASTRHDRSLIRRRDPVKPHCFSNGLRSRNGALAIQNDTLEQGEIKCGVGEKWDSSDETRRPPLPQQREGESMERQARQESSAVSEIAVERNPIMPCDAGQTALHDGANNAWIQYGYGPPKEVGRGRPNNASHQFTDSHLGPHQKGAPGGFSIPKESTRQAATVMRTEGHQDV